MTLFVSNASFSSLSRMTRVIAVCIALQACAPQNTIAYTAEGHQYATQWFARNAWFNQNGTDPDSKVALQVDAKLSHEGYDHNKRAYWTELTRRLKLALPHRAASIRDGKNDSESAKQYCARQGLKPKTAVYKKCIDEIAQEDVVMQQQRLVSQLREEEAQRRTSQTAAAIENSRPVATAQTQTHECDLAPRDMSGAYALANSANPNMAAMGKAQIARENARQQRNALRCGDNQSYYQLRQLEIQEQQIELQRQQQLQQQQQQVDRMNARMPTTTNCRPNGVGGIRCTTY